MSKTIEDRPVEEHPPDEDLVLPDEDTLIELVRAEIERQFPQLDQPPTEPEPSPDTGGRVLALAELPGIRESREATAALLRYRDTGDVAGYLDLVEEILNLTLGVSGESSPGPVTAASAVTPGGGGAPNDLQQAYQMRRSQLKPGDVNALTALKREFRQKGLDVF